MKSMCAVTNNGTLGCWDAYSKALDEILPK